jgi:hypothetical protein
VIILEITDSRGRSTLLWVKFMWEVHDAYVSNHDPDKRWTDTTEIVAKKYGVIIDQRTDRVVLFNSEAERTMFLLRFS